MKLSLILNEPGGGSVTIPKADPSSGDIEAGKLIRVAYRGDNREAFFVEDIREQRVVSGDYSAQEFIIQGRTALSVLADAVVWYTAQGETVREFTSVTAASILIDLIDEAVVRGCFPQLEYDFTALVDSDGVSWTDSRDLEFRVGTTVLNVMKKIASLGIDFHMDFDWPRDKYILQAFKDGRGSDKSATVIFREGKNCLRVSTSEQSNELKNVILTEYSEGQFSTVTDATSITAYRRRERLLSASQAGGSTDADDYGQAELDDSKDPDTAITVQVTDGDGPMLFVDYDVGDTIGYAKYDATAPVTYRIRGMDINWGKDEEFAQVYLHLNSMRKELLIRASQAMEKMGGSLGSYRSQPTDVTQSINNIMIDDDHIDWGLGANQVSAEDMPIEDAGGYYTGSEIETALQEIGDGTTLNGSYLQIVNNLSDLANVATARTNLGVAIGSDVLAYDVGLQNLAGVAMVADRFYYTSADNVHVAATVTAFARTLLDDVNAAAMRTTLELIAGGAGDIWVEKAGDTMTVALDGDSQVDGTFYRFLELSTGTKGLILGVLSDSNTGVIAPVQATNNALAWYTHNGASWRQKAGMSKEGYMMWTADNSTTAYQFQQADGTVVLNVDTVNKRMGIGTVPDANLHIASTAIAGREDLIFAEVSDASGAYFKVNNATSTGGLFVPTFAGLANSTSKPSLTFIGDVTGYTTGTRPGLYFRTDYTGTLNRDILQFGKYAYAVHTYYLTMGKNGHVDIGGVLARARLQVTGIADEIQQIIQAHSTQTSHVIEQQQSDTTVVIYTTNAGTIASSGGRIVNTTKVTTTYTALVTDREIFCDTDGGAFTLTLPAGVNGQHFRIHNVGTSGNDLTIDGSGAETIRNELTQTLMDCETLIITFETTEHWY